MTVAFKVHKHARKAIVIGAAELSGEYYLAWRGFFTNFLIELPNYTAALTGALIILNNEATPVEVYSVAGMPKNDQTNVVVDPWTSCPINGLYTIRLTLSVVPAGAGGTAYITPYSV